MKKLLTAVSAAALLVGANTAPAHADFIVYYLVLSQDWQGPNAPYAETWVTTQNGNSCVIYSWQGYYNALDTKMFTARVDHLPGNIYTSAGYCIGWD